MGVAVPVVIPRFELPKKAAEDPSSWQRSKLTFAPIDLISVGKYRWVQAATYQQNSFHSFRSARKIAHFPPEGIDY